MRKRRFIAGVGASILFLAMAMVTAAENKQKPNVIFIIADDLGYGDTQLYGATKLYKTPNLLRFAERGMTFKNAYSSGPLCSPSRGAIMSGLNPARTGLLGAEGHKKEVRLKSEMPDNPKVPAWNRAARPRNATRLDTAYT